MNANAMMTRLRSVAAATLITLSLAAAGCGSSRSQAPAPTPTPTDEADKTAAAILADAAAAAGGLHGYRTAFKGLDGDGQLAFDVVVDGRGGLSGSFTRGGVKGDILLVGTTLYVRGRALITALDGQELPPQYEGRWIQYRSGPQGGLLETLRRPSLLASCLRASDGTVHGQGTSQLGAHRVVGLDARAGHGEDWHVQVSVARDGAPLPVRITVLASEQPPASCTGGAADEGGEPSRPGTGTIGSLDIAPAPDAPAVAPPTDPLQLPPTGP
jgi:hypothetical protein